VRKRAAAWVETRIRLGLSELMDARATSELPAGARGIIFQLCESLGVLPRRPIERQLSELGEEDRKALAKLGVRVGVYSLYFPSMLKPVPIRLRAGLWMIGKSRETIPPLPAEGRTSLDLPRDADREFYAAIGYLPLGDHAIRADMVERLAAMARQAVRESREAVRRVQQAQEKGQQEKGKQENDKKATTEAEPVGDVAAAEEISEWAIVAAAFGESEPASEPAPSPETAAVAEEIQAEAIQAEEAAAEPIVPDEAAASPSEAVMQDPQAEETRIDESKPEPAKNDGPRPLPAGWFRATSQMMSLVGCSEPEMADVLRGLGYRVHPPSEEHGPLHVFSIKPRFVREREEQRERQREQQRQHREHHRRERPERPNERQFFADTQRIDRGKDNQHRPGPRQEGPRQEGSAGKAPRADRPEADRPREDRRGPRAPRRDSGGPALRLYATTEKKGDSPSDSPFAKLLELKLGGKK
jgi:ATP-dependent RNA helicase SUPV3L1/SUV3